MYRRVWAALRLAASNGDRGDRKRIRLGTYRGQGVQGVALLYIHLFWGDKAHEQTKDALLQPIPSRASVPPADSAGWAPDPEKATGKADPKSPPSGRAHREMISLLPRHARQTVSSSPPSFLPSTPASCRRGRTTCPQRPTGFHHRREADRPPSPQRTHWSCSGRPAKRAETRTRRRPCGPKLNSSGSGKAAPIDAPPAKYNR